MGAFARTAPIGRRLRRLVVRFGSADLRERLFALVLLVAVAIGAGLWLGHSSERLEELPGLLLMVPAAIALRGNIFGALGARLGTAIHAGTFRLSIRPSTVVGANVIASAILSVGASLLLAVSAKGVAVVFGVAGAISMLGFVLISVVGGLLASVIVLITALALTSGSVRFGWDPDNVTAPLVTAVGDVATIPSLIVAAALLGRQWILVTVAGTTLLVVAGSTMWLWRSSRGQVRVIVRESIPILAFAIVVDLVAGVTVEKQLDSFLVYPSLLVLFPAFLAAAGALGGTLSSRLATSLHLGTIEPSPLPPAQARGDIGDTVVLAVVVFAGCGGLAHAAALATGLSTPGFGWMIASALLGGFLANTLASLVAYYATIFSVRVGLDPDTWGIPAVTSTVDLLGAFALILVIQALGFV